MTTQPTIAPSKLHPHPSNPRRDVGDVTDLVASARQLGILEPLVVAPPPEGTPGKAGKADYLVLCGNRRLAAAKKARLKEVPVVIRDDLATLADQVDAMLVENLHRVDLTPIEEGDAYQLRMDLDGLTQKDLAALIGQPRTRISQRLRLAKADTPVRDATHTGQISIDDALAVVAFDDDPVLLASIVEAIGTDDFRFRLNRAKRLREEARQQAALLKRVEQAGIPVLDSMPPGSSYLSHLRIDSTWPSPYDAEWESEHHADCPGRAAVRTSGGPGVAFICTEPQRHSGSPTTDASTPSSGTSSREDIPRLGEETPEEAAEREARQAAEREKRDLAARDRAAAAATRDEFVRDLLCKGGPPGKGIVLTDDVARGRLVDLILDRLSLIGEDAYDNSHDVRWLLQLLTGKEPDLPEGPDHLVLADLVTQHVKDRNLHNLVLVLDVVTHRSAADELSRGYPGDATSWLDALNAYGYTWSTYEREQFRFPRRDGDYELTGYVWTVDGIVDERPPTQAAEGDA